MFSSFARLLVFGIGISAGLRTMTAPATVAWAAHLGWINLAGSPLGFMGSAWAVTLFTIAALVEYVIDLLPSTPPRTRPFGLTCRVATSLLAGACLGVAEGTTGVGVPLSALLAAVAAIAGAFGGFQVRTRLVRALRVPDAVIAIPEDLVAIGLGLLCCFEIQKFHTPLAVLLVHLSSRAYL